MKKGDLVRFVKLEELRSWSSKSWSKVQKKHIGTLISHDKLMSTCEVLYKGSIIKMRSQLAEKAGKKDLSEERNSVD